MDELLTIKILRAFMLVAKFVQGIKIVSIKIFIFDKNFRIFI